MGKRVGDTLIEAEYVEYAVEYEVSGETFVTVADDEEHARLMRAALNGHIVTRKVYESSWADAPYGGR